MNPNCHFLLAQLARSATCLALLGASWVYALPSDQNQSIYITADKQEISLKDGVVTYIGDVKLIQGTLHINADRLSVHKDKKQTEEFVLAEGGPAHYEQQPEEGKAIVHAEAGLINYNLKTQMLVLDKNVAIEQAGAITKGGHVDYDTKSQTFKATKGDDNPTGRVETVIPPKTDKDK